ncbi:MAG: alkaline phosphatase D family protein [Halioglobus sp.]|nr:alkaline phosphatase D family protein [Halioglobus sp.]
MTWPIRAGNGRPAAFSGHSSATWFLEYSGRSTAHWKLWGNALPLIPMRLDLSTLPFTVYEDSIFTIDPWAGYPHEVRNLMDALRGAGVSGLVSLSGDHHMHGAGTVSRSPGEPEAPAVLADFTVAGISSAPIFEDLLAVARENYGNFNTLVYRETGGEVEPVWNMSLLDGVLAAYLYAKTGIRTMARWFGPNEANPGLRYVDTTANGYGLARFDADELTVRHITMEDCRPAFEAPPGIRHTATLRVARWEADGSPTIEGPTFEGGAPFPFDVDST